MSNRGQTTLIIGLHHLTYLFIISMILLFLVTLKNTRDLNDHGVIKKTFCNIQKLIPLNYTCYNIEDNSCKYISDADCLHLPSCDYMIKNRQEGDCCLENLCINKTKQDTFIGTKNCKISSNLCYDLQIDVNYILQNPPNIVIVNPHKWYSSITLSCGIDKKCLDNKIKSYTENNYDFFKCYYYENDPYRVTIVPYDYNSFVTYFFTIFSFTLTGFAFIVVIIGIYCIIRRNKRKSYLIMNENHE